MSIPSPHPYPAEHPRVSPFLFEASARRRPASSLARRAHIVATVGPACDDAATLVAMAEAGMDVARIPLAHGSLEDAVQRLHRIRATLPGVGVLPDLPGPKVRTTPFGEGGVSLVAGLELDLLPGEEVPVSGARRVGVALEGATDLLEAGDVIAFGDGGISIEVLGRDGSLARALVRSGGHLEGRPGVSLPDSRLLLTTPTEEDLVAAARLAEEGVEFIAVSFVRTAADLHTTRAAIGAGGPMLVAKIETRDGVEHLEEILRASDAVMVARGDLGVRLPLEEIPHLQKRIIRDGVRFGLPVITATQMLESMIAAAVPTRAEVTDVANAVLDGTSAVMLSGETAIGAHPVEVVATMDRIVRRTEADFDAARWGAGLGLQEVSGDASSPARITAAITGAGWRAAIEEDAAAIIACTRNGATARAIARFRPGMPIVAATPLPATARQLQLSWGVEALVVRESASTDDIVTVPGRGGRRGSAGRTGTGRRRRRPRRLADRVLAGHRHAAPRTRPLRRRRQSIGWPLPAPRGPVSGRPRPGRGPDRRTTTIATGEQIPDVQLRTMGAEGPQTVSSRELLGSPRVVLFAVPGAFTPTCSDCHLPGYVLRAEELAAAGVDRIACVSVNDAFVMAAWGESRAVGDKVLMIADGNGEFAREMGLERDASANGLGLRSQRYAAIIDDGVISHLAVEEKGLDVSSAESILKVLSSS